MKHFFLTAIFLLFSVSPANAFTKETYFHLTLPVRHLAPTAVSPQSTLDLPISVYNESTPSGTPITWLLEYDVAASATDSAYFTALAQQPRQDVGLLLEITENLQKAAGISPARPMLSGFPLPDRYKIIDTLFTGFFDRFHRYPRVIAASYIDSASLSYISSKYPVELALFSVYPSASHQPELINPPLPWSVYYPSSYNSLIPSGKAHTKINIPVTSYNPPIPGSSQPLDWAQVSALASSGSLDSLFSPLSLKSLNEFTQITLGVDNSYPQAQAMPTFVSLFQYLSSHRDQYTLQPQTLSQFGLTFKGRYPFTSPAYLFVSLDKSKAYYTNPFYQAEISSASTSGITRLTVFNDLQTETYRNTPVPLDFIRLENTSEIQPDKPVDLHLDHPLIYTNEYWDLVATSSGQTLRFEPKKIKLNSSADPIPQSHFITRDWFNSRLYHIRPNHFPFSGSLLTPLITLVLVVLLAFFARHFLRLPLIILAVVLGITVILSLTIFKSGSLTEYGLSFWGAHEHDALFHLSLINSLSDTNFSLIHPTLINSTITNYHIGFDLLLAILSKITIISPLDLYFRLIPPILIFLLSLSIFLLCRRFRFSQTTSLLALFFAFFTGSLGFLRQGGESLFWSMQPISMLLNPPFTLSLLGLTLFFIFDGEKSRSKQILKIVIFALLLQTKTYAFLLLAAAFGLRLLIRFSKHDLAVLAAGSFLAFLSVLPTHRLGSQVFLLKPLWFPQTMVTTLDRFSWPQAANALYAYAQQSQPLKLFTLTLGLTFIFIVGNFGIRLLGLYHLKQPQTRTQVLLWLIIALGTIIPLLIIQAGNPWNTIQFLYYPLFFSGIFLAPVVINLLKHCRNIITLTLCLGLILLFTLPTTIGTLKIYVSPSPSTAIPYEEVAALDYLSRQPSGRVLFPYPSQYGYHFYGPSPLFNFVSTAYVSALSGQPSVFADDINLEIMGYDYTQVKKDSQQFFATSDTTTAVELLCRLQVAYVYQPALIKLTLNPTLLGLTPIYKNPLINIYRFSYEDICRR